MTILCAKVVRNQWVSKTNKRNNTRYVQENNTFKTEYSTSETMTG
jgi:hypothetical protein